MKLDSFEALAKMHKGLATHFTKLAEGHTAMSKAHGEHAAFMKGTHDAMADDHEQKAYFGKAAAHHEHMSGLHKAHADAHEAAAAACDGDGKAAKAAGDPVPTTGDPLVNKDEPSIKDFFKSMLTEAMKEEGKGDFLKGMFREWIQEQAKDALGKTIVPTNVKAVGTAFDPTKPVTGPMLVPRPGQELQKEAATEMPAALSDWIPD